MIDPAEPLLPSQVAALIPAYFEERHIGDVVARTRAQVGIVLVVDDGSQDATLARAHEAGAEVVRHSVNHGKGAAIKTGLAGLLSSHATHFILLDGDGQHRPEEIPAFIAEAGRSDADLIIGSRMSDAAKMPIVRRLTNQFMSWAISRVCGQPIPDTQCGFRMVHRRIAPDLFCDTNSYDYETEMLFIASRAGHRIRSVPISTIYGDEVSKIRPARDTVRFLRLLARYRS